MNSSKKETREKFDYNSTLGDHYIDLRHQSLLEGKSKSLIIPYVVSYLKRQSSQKRLTLMDLGCGDGSMLEMILKHIELPAIEYIGVDFNKTLLDIAQSHFPKIKFIHSDITSEKLSMYKGKCDVVLMINTLHEIFSFESWNGGFSPEKGFKAVNNIFPHIVELIAPGGRIILFDGVEHGQDLKKKIQIRLITKEALKLLKKFNEEYLPYQESIVIEGDIATMSVQYFTRFVTKMRFIETDTWNLEKEESYQYLTDYGLEKLFKENGLSIRSKSLIAPNLGRWGEKIEILSKDISFPFEHIMVMGKK